MTITKASRLLLWILVLGFFLATPVLFFEPAFTQENILAKTGSLQGVVTAEFKTQEGTMTLIAPEGLWAGGTFAGSVRVEPAGKAEAEKRKNREKMLTQYAFQIAGQVISLRDEYYTVTLPTSLSTTEKSVVLRGKKGNPLATTPLPVQPQPPAALASATLQGQNVVQAGRPMVFQGQGLVTPNLKTTTASIGGQPAKPLTATANTLAVQCPSGLQGTVPWQVTNGGVTSTGQTHVANVSFSANKSVIQPGEQVIAHLTVTGVEDSDEEIPVTVDNTTLNTISVAGGNHQIIRIPKAADRKEKDFSKDFILTGIHAGGFNLVATLLSEAPQPGANTGSGPQAPGRPVLADEGDKPDKDKKGAKTASTDTPLPGGVQIYDADGNKVRKTDEDDADKPTFFPGKQPDTICKNQGCTFDKEKDKAVGSCVAPTKGQDCDRDCKGSYCIPYWRKATPDKGSKIAGDDGRWTKVTLPNERSPRFDLHKGQEYACVCGK